MKNNYIVNFSIKDSEVIKAESPAKAKQIFLDKKKIKKGILLIDYIESA